MKSFVVAFVVLIANLCAGAQDDWHTYPFREIKELVKQEDDLYRQSGSRGDIVISAKPFPAKTLVTYTGMKRPAGHYTKVFIRLWVTSRNVPPGNVDLLVEEHLFKEKGVEYWMPVHAKVAPTLQNEFKPGDEITIYYFYLGGYNGRLLQQKDEAQDKPTAPEANVLRRILAVEKVERPRTDFTEQLLEKAIDRSMERAAGEDH
jgi:hypothetical protein